MLYKIAWVLLKIYFFIVYRFTIRGRENVPASGGVIFCANHVSLMDPVILAMITRRQVRYVAKRELFNGSFASFFLKRLGAFPVDRSKTDMTAYKKAIELLKNGEVLGVFAQGARFKELDAKDAKAGVALFALKSDAEVVPVAINTTYKPFSRISVNVGKPADLSGYRDKKLKSDMLNEITENIMNEVERLMRDAEATEPPRPDAR